MVYSGSRTRCLDGVRGCPKHLNGKKLFIISLFRWTSRSGTLACICRRWYARINLPEWRDPLCRLEFACSSGHVWCYTTPCEDVLVVFFSKGADYFRISVVSTKSQSQRFAHDSGDRLFGVPWWWSMPHDVKKGLENSYVITHKCFLWWRPHWAEEKQMLICLRGVLASVSESTKPKRKLYDRKSDSEAICVFAYTPGQKLLVATPLETQSSTCHCLSTSFLTAF